MEYIVFNEGGENKSYFLGKTCRRRLSPCLIEVYVESSRHTRSCHNSVSAPPPPLTSSDFSVPSKMSIYFIHLLCSVHKCPDSFIKKMKDASSRGRINCCCLFVGPAQVCQTRALHRPGSSFSHLGGRKKMVWGIFIPRAQIVLVKFRKKYIELENSNSRPVALF